jgi:hypothetical protein
LAVSGLVLAVAVCYLEYQPFVFMGSKNMEQLQAKNVYRWLWWSPLLTIPTHLLIIIWNPGSEYYCCNSAIEHRITGIFAVMVSALWHLTLLKAARDKKNFFVCWHGRQALTLAGLRTAIPLFLILLLGYVGNFFAIFILIFVWLIGTLWGQDEAKHGSCTLAHWFGHADELPGPLMDPTQQIITALPSEDEINRLVHTIRFSQDREERAKALSKLHALGVVEYL